MFDYEENFYVEKEVGVPAKKTWEIISMPDSLTLFHFFMEKHASENWDGAGND